jgi:hypothetical protein
MIVIVGIHARYCIKQELSPQLKTGPEDRPISSESSTFSGTQVVFPIRLFTYLLICAACNDFAGYATITIPESEFFGLPPSACLQQAKVELR